MRYAARRDGNHAELRKQCAGLGISWQDIAPSRGGGQPDALLGWRGRNRIVEIKDPEASNTDRKLRPNQVAWARAWQGEKPVKVETLAEILALFACLMLFLSCAQAEAQPPPVCDHAELQAQLALLRADLARVETELDDARWLSILGGPKRRWKGGGIECDPSLYLDESAGRAGQRALHATGFCEPPPLPTMAKRR